jgi:Tfp pilus assembly PilM family ATPase
MLRLIGRKPHLGIEITGKSIRVASVSGRRENLSVLYTKSVDLPAGMVNETYASPNIEDFYHVNSVLRDCLNDAPSGIRRAALSLPDGIFRVQTFEFDTLPSKGSDRERLIRWRLEKGAAFDMTDTVFRYQVLGRQNKRFTVLACVAKQAVIAQYESLLIEMGFELWAIGPSSFHALNFYSSYIANKSAVSAFAYLAADTFATIIVEAGGVTFYRYKDVKRGSVEEIRGRLMSGIDDSLHFYTHMDRVQQSDIQNLYLTGESIVSEGLAEGMRNMTALNVEMLSPAIAALSAQNVAPEMASALGAGISL